MLQMHLRARGGLFAVAAWRAAVLRTFSRALGAHREHRRAMLLGGGWGVS